jgi:hypothetical protein
MMMAVLTLHGCGPKAEKKGEYWVVGPVESANRLMFKGKEIGNIGKGLTAYKTDEGNWILYGGPG